MYLEDFLNILFILIGTIGGFCAGYGIQFLIHAAGKNATIWEFKFDPLPKVDKGRIIGITGWPIMILGMFLPMLIWLQDPWDDALGFLIVIYVGLAALAAVLPGTILGDKHLKQTLMNSKNALPLDELPIMQDVDAHIENAKAVAIFADGIVLFDEKDYGFFTAQYTNYTLGILTNSDQIKLLGYYFRQKYGTQFKYKPNVENVYTNNRVVAANVISILFVRQDKR